MRLVLIGCEYVGKTTLADALEAWGPTVGRKFHMDDSDFSIPDDRHLNEEEQKALYELPRVLKERFMRFQIYYHLDVIKNWEDCILGGWHIQEAVYGPRYCYPGVKTDYYFRRVEAYMPEDTVLVLMRAPADVIRSRMEAAPHKYPIVPASDVEDVQAEFEAQYQESRIVRKMTFESHGFPPEEVLNRFLEAVHPKLSTRDLLMMS